MRAQVASLGEDFWQITLANTSWTAKRITADPEDWLIINSRRRTVIQNDTVAGRQIIRWVKRYEATI